MRFLARDYRARVSRRPLQGVLLAAAVACAPSVAHAEQLVMPFSCTMDDGFVQLAPSVEQRYQILGSRQHHVFTVCSPRDQRQCRNWKIHRFVVDCGGAPVPWLKVIDAASNLHGKRAWVDSGVMNVEVGPRNRILSYGGDTPERFGRPIDRFRARAREAMRSRLTSVVQLPPGFAPTLGLPVRFEGGPGGTSGSFNAVVGPPPIPQADQMSEAERAFVADGARDAPGVFDDAQRETAAPPIPLPVPKPEVAARPDAPPSDGAWDAQVTSGESSKPPVKVAEKEAPSPKQPAARPVKTPPPAAQKKPAADKAKPPASSSPTEPPTAASRATPAKPKILNRASEGEGKVAGDGDAAAEKNTSIKTAAGPQVSASPPVVAPEDTAESKLTVNDVGIVAPNAPADATRTADDSGPSYVMLGLAGLTVLGLGGLAYLFGRRLFGSSTDFDRDLHSVDLKTSGRRAAATAPSGKDVVVAAAANPFTPEATAVAQPASSATSQSASAGDVATPPSPPPLGDVDLSIPTNLEDALKVVGASADAAIEGVKKIVDGLRLSWHPDHAKNEGDRLYRERRMQQINVAWDIISAHQRAREKA